MTNSTTQGGTRTMYPYEPIFSKRIPSKTAETRIGSTRSGILNHVTGRFSDRSDYSDIDLASLARWLNDRHEGYPPFNPTSVELSRAELMR